jgi:predicted glycosyltransferase involved in capsule biosynthesis
MKNCCYIICHRDYSLNTDRTRNLLAVIKHIRSRYDISILVLEQDKLPNKNLIRKLLDLDVNYQFLYNPGLFNRSWGLNCGAKLSLYENLVLADNDSLLNNDDLKKGLDCLDNYSIVKPYNKTFDLTEQQTFDYINNSILPNTMTHTQQRMGTVMASGLIMIRKKFFLQIGGYDERFEGWGGEDNEMTNYLATKINSGKSKYYKFGSNLLHMYHARSILDGNNQPNYKKNLSFIKDYDKRNQNTIIGQIDKYIK